MRKMKTGIPIQTKKMHFRQKISSLLKKILDVKKEASFFRYAQ